MADDEEVEAPPPYVFEGARAEGEEFELKSGGKTKSITLLGAKQGEGKAAYPNGDSYEGSYAEDKRSGRGTYVYAAQPRPAEGEEALPPIATYEGTWKHGKKDGIGQLTFADGAEYDGQLKRNKRDGTGTFFYANGDIYTGSWENDLKHGQGLYIYKQSGAQIQGTWDAGKIVTGVFTDKFGCFYEGSFDEDAETGSPLFPTGAVLLEPREAPLKPMTKRQAKRKAFMRKQRKAWRPPEPEAKPLERPKVDWHSLNIHLPSGRGPEALAARDRMFDQLDANHDGALAYAEVEKKLCGLLLGDQEHDSADDHICDPRPAILSAFDTAKFQHEERKAHGKGLHERKQYEPHVRKGTHMEEMVERIEFRLMLSYLRVHFELLVMFDIVDDSDDGEISYNEFVHQIPEIEKWGIKVYNPRLTFMEIDSDHKGTIDFDEFREWALAKNLDLDDDEDAGSADLAAHQVDALHAHHTQ
jgi:hypothetical protein